MNEEMSLTLAQLQERAYSMRQDVIRMLTKAGSGHAGGALGMAEIMTALYHKVLHHDPQTHFGKIGIGSCFPMGISVLFCMP